MCWFWTAQQPNHHLIHAKAARWYVSAASDEYLWDVPVPSLVASASRLKSCESGKPTKPLGSVKREPSDDHEFGRCTWKHLENSLAFDPKKRNRRVFCQSRWWDFDDLMIVQGHVSVLTNLGEKPAESITYSANTPLQHLHIGVIGHQLNQQGGGCGQETTVQHLERWPRPCTSDLKKFHRWLLAFQFHCQQKGAMFFFLKQPASKSPAFFHLLLIWEMGNHLEESHFEHRKKGSSKKKVILPQI